jgi:hypothetical protein
MMGKPARTTTDTVLTEPANAEPDSDRLARVRAIPRRGTPEELAQVLERFRQLMAEPPLVVDWEVIRDAEADHV